MAKTISGAFNVVVELDAVSGRRISEEWYTKAGERHRDGGEPAWQQWDVSTGVKTFEAFYSKDRLHRIGAPAWIEWDAETGTVIGETWSEYGLIHREDDKPAIWMKDPVSGIFTMEQYRYSGLQHRLYGPAEIWRDPETGEPGDEAYYRMGKRLAPPATVSSPGLAP